MNILVTNSNSSQFQFVICEGADTSMKVFAKMTILLAIQEHPDDDSTKNDLIGKKFREQYRWSQNY